MRGSHRAPVNSPHKGQWREALMYSLICDWTNGWANGDAGDLRRHRAHYDVIVMTRQLITIQYGSSITFPGLYINHKHNLKLVLAISFGQLDSVLLVDNISKAATTLRDIKLCKVLSQIRPFSNKNIINPFRCLFFCCDESLHYLRVHVLVCVCMKLSLTWDVSYISELVVWLK